jgi:hypothetical protein
VLAVAHPKRESWVLAGFDPQNDAEGERLQSVSQDLGFDPRMRTGSLAATGANHPRNPKRILAFLLGESEGREAVCWKEPSLDLLAKRGKSTGLADYLTEVRQKLAVLFTR